MSITSLLVSCILQKNLHINILRKCLTCNFSSLTLAHSQAGRRADDKAEEAGVLVLFFFHLFLVLFLILLCFLYPYTARDMMVQTWYTCS